MPELPEVETVKRDLIPYLVGQRINAIRILDSRVIRNITPKKFVSQLTGKVFKDIARRGKAIIFRLDPSIRPASGGTLSGFRPAGGQQDKNALPAGLHDGQHLIVQLMMTGQLVHAQTLPAVPLKETKIIFELSNGTYLNYNDQRLFGRLSLIRKLEDFKHFTLLGPEPFDASFNPKFIKESLKQRSVAVKSALMDHTFVAGIGNIYASEILFRSRIDPRRKAKGIKSVEIESMHRVTLEVLDEAIRFRGSSMRNYRDGKGEKGTFNKLIKVYAREDEPCLSCSKPIVKIVQSGRSTFFCKNCQH